MNRYEQKQADRADRLRERARKQQRESEGRLKAAHDSISGIPPGQPILIGHHSEKRHRAALARHDVNMRKGLDAGDYARHLNSRAAGIEHRLETGSGPISSDDPDAPAKLTVKIRELEELHAAKKAANAAVRKAKKAAGDVDHRELIRELLEAGTLTPALAGDLVSSARAFPWLPQFDLGLSAKNLKRYRDRLEELERAAEVGVAPDPIEGDGYEILENGEENRVQIVFPGKPAADVRARLRMLGFRWARSQGAWQRQLNGAGRAAAGGFHAWMISRAG